MSDRLKIMPITLTLYNNDNEPTKTLQMSVVRWGLMKSALELAKKIGAVKGVSDDTFDLVASFVCRLFGDQVTVEELENGADFGEILSVFRAVVKRANAAGNA